MTQKTSQPISALRVPRPFTLSGKLRTFFRTGPLYAWRFTGPSPERISYDVVDFVPGNPQHAREIYLGIYNFQTGHVETGTQSPFTMADETPGWRAQLHGFDWLRHLTASGDDLMSGNARALIDDWQQACLHDMRSLPWQPAIAAQRLNSFLRHAPMVLKGCNQAFYRRFCGLIARHVRYLRSIVRQMEPSADRLQVRSALMIASVAVPMSAKRQKRFQLRLERDLADFILPDGMPVTRNIDDAVHTALDLLSLITVMANASYAVPDSITRALDQLFPAINAMAHSGGTLAAFNGSGAFPMAHLTALLAHDPTNGSIATLDSHAHYRRLERADTCVIADTGALPQPPFDRHAMAGSASFEMSSDGHRFIVNAGPDIQQLEDRFLIARATAAHSAAVFDDKSTAQFNLFHVRHEQVICTASHMPNDTTDEPWHVDDWRGFQVGHDGYAKHGFAYDRGVRLSADGCTIEGFDRFTPVTKGKSSTTKLVTLRFHLDPDIAASKDAENGDIIIWPKSGDPIGWVFAVRKAECHIEQSIRFANDGGPRQSKAIVVTFRPSDHDMIFWRLDKKRKTD